MRRLYTSRSRLQLAVSTARYFKQLFLASVIFLIYPAQIRIRIVVSYNRLSLSRAIKWDVHGMEGERAGKEIRLFVLNGGPG